MQFQKQQGVDILFEEKLLEGHNDYGQSQLNAIDHSERNLTQLLRPLGLRLKKISKDTYVVVASKTTAAKAALRVISPPISINRLIFSMPTQRLGSSQSRRSY
ncbi:MAG: hypothetical protein R2822_10470 [Spirosomataceae bacterium]